MDDDIGFTSFHPLSPESENESIQSGTLSSRPSFFSRWFKSEPAAPVKITPNSSQISFRNGAGSSDSELSGALPVYSDPSAVNIEQTPSVNPRLDPVSVLSTATTENPKRRPYPYTGASSSSSSLSREGSVKNVQLRSNIAKISNILAGSLQSIADPLSSRFDPETGQRLQDYNRSDYKQTWMPDRSGKECYACNEKFSTFRRRHHCRICGQIFCSRCCSMGIPGKLLGYMGDLRLCNHCYENVVIQLNDANAESNSMQNDGGASPSPRPQRRSMLRTISQTSAENSGEHNISTVGSTRIYQHQQSVFDHLAEEGDDYEQREVEIVKPRLLSVADLVNSQLPEVPQETEENELFVDDTEPEWVRNLRPGGERVVSAPEMPVQDLPQPNGYMIPLRKPSPFPPPSPSLPSALPSPTRDGGMDGDVTSMCSFAAADGHDLQHIFDTHAVKLLKYVLNREELQEKLWLPVLWPLCQELAFTLQPNVRDNKDSMDVLEYLHVKALTSKVEKPYAQAIFGTAFCKSVADNRMKRHLINPSVMIVGGSIEYERGGVKLCSIEPVMMQETQYLQNVVHKIAMHSPSILVVEKGVANIAQRFIREKGITLVYNVKEIVIKRIARCTKADILRTVESGVTKPKLGSCGSFRVITAPCISGANVDCHGEKRIMLFEECQPDLSCALMLHANSYKHLRKAKRILKFMVSTVYSCKLETALLKSLHACVDRPTKEGDGNEQVSMNCCRQLSNSQVNLLSQTECQVCIENRKFDPKSQTYESTAEHSLCESLSKSTLNCNPFQCAGLPYLESAAGKNCKLMDYFKKPLYRFKDVSSSSLLQNGDVFDSRNYQPIDCVDVSSQMKNKIEKVARGENQNEMHGFLRENVVKAAADIPSLDNVANFRALGSRIFKQRYAESRKDGTRFQVVTGQTCRSNTTSPKQSPERNQDTRDVLDPYNHQHLAVLFSSYCSKSENAPGFCIDPWVVWMDFYGLHDLPLGDFLIRFCFNRAYKCPGTRNKNCDISMLEHIRKIVHGHASIEISTQTIMEDQDASQAAPDAILSWDYCGRCKMSTAAAPMNNQLWHLSFAKYLEYLFSGQHLHSHIAVGPQSNDASLCPHCLFHQHDHFFAFKNYVTCFKISPIKLYEVAFSPMECTIADSSVPVGKMVQESMDTSEDAGALFTRMLESIVAFRNHSEASKFGTTQKELNKIAEQGQEYFRCQVNQVQELLTKLPTDDAAVIDAKDLEAFMIKDGLERCRYILATAMEKWNREVMKFQVMRKRIISSSSSSALQHMIEDLNNSNAVKEEAKPAAPVMQLAVDPNMNKPSENETAANFGNASPLKRASGSSLTEVENIGSSIINPLAKKSTKNPFPIEELNSDLFKKPFKSSEHYTLRLGNIPIIVRDNEIGSIVAYALASPEYEKQRGENRDACGNSGVPVTLKACQFDDVDEKSNPSSYFNQQRNKSGQDVIIQFSDSIAKYYCKIYYAEHFRMLRKLLFPAGEEVFIRSIANTEPWTPKGGKSGAAFHRTQDKRFILKQMNRFEIQSFLDFAPHYFNFISTAATENKLTALAKIYGVFRVGFENSRTGRTEKMDLFVMEYLFYKRNVSQVYDLKGSMRNRLVSESQPTHQQPDLVLMDENLLKKTCANPLFLQPHSKVAISMALTNDRHFLANHRVMDYSLLVGVDEETGELIMGLIDYIRTYTLDKKLETLVKSAIVGASLPTVISPELYQTRFAEAIDVYFPPAPDQWTGLTNGDEGAAIKI